jgi:prophage regulatory protein
MTAPGPEFGEEAQAAARLIPEEALSIAKLALVYLSESGEIEFLTLNPKTDFLGLQEISIVLGVSKQRVHQLSANPDFPRPYTRVSNGPIWLRPIVEEYDLRRHRDPSRFPIASKGSEPI